MLASIQKPSQTSWPFSWTSVLVPGGFSVALNRDGADKSSTLDRIWQVKRSHSLFNSVKSTQPMYATFVAAPLRSKVSLNQPSRATNLLSNASLPNKSQGRCPSLSFESEEREVFVSFYLKGEVRKVRGLQGQKARRLRIKHCYRGSMTSQSSR